LANPKNPIGPDRTPRALHAFILLVAVTLAYWGTAGLASAATAPGHRVAISAGRIAKSNKPPLLLLIPGGGFIKRYDSMPVVARGLGREQGYAVEDVGYKLNDPLGAWKQIRDLAGRAKRNGRDVYAYGESVGGNFAALLAEKRLARAASANAPPSDLTDWSLPGVVDYWAGMKNHGLGTRRVLSPAFHQSPSPILIQQSLTDPYVPAKMNQRWAQRDPNVRLEEYAGFHVVGLDLRTYADNVRDAFAFLARQRARVRIAEAH
jgi:pimeloyl-ACP methyl ester carboxylesterase